MTNIETTSHPDLKPDATARRAETIQEQNPQTALNMGAVSLDIATGNLATGALPDSQPHFTQEHDISASNNLEKAVESSRYDILGENFIKFHEARLGLATEAGMQDGTLTDEISQLKESVAQSAADAAAQTLEPADLDELTEKIDKFDDSEIEHSRLLKPWTIKQGSTGHEVTPQKTFMIATAAEITRDPSLFAAAEVMASHMFESGSYRLEGEAVARAIDTVKDYETAQTHYVNTYQAAAPTPANELYVFTQAYTQEYKALNHHDDAPETSNNPLTDQDTYVTFEAYSASPDTHDVLREMNPREALQNGIATFSNLEKNQAPLQERQLLAVELVQRAEDALEATTDSEEHAATDTKDIALAYLLVDAIEITSRMHGGENVPNSLVRGLRQTIAEADSHMQQKETSILGGISKALNAFELAGRDVDLRELVRTEELRYQRDIDHLSATTEHEAYAKSIIGVTSTVALQS